MRKTLFIASFLLTAGGLFAADKNESDMLKLASKQLQAIGVNTQPQRIVERETFNVYGASEGGFVIVSKGENTQDILGYSSKAFPSEDHMPCGLKWWMDAIEETLKGNNQVRKARAYTEVDNFLRTEWGQDAPYNDHCPEVNGERTPSGCIATAMAQVMRYYEWPAQGIGMGSYSVNDDDYPDQSVTSVYNWSDMPYVRYTAMTKKKIREAVATLLFDCGKATKMHYTLEGSGAYEYDQALALARNFQYDSLSLKCLDRSFYEENEWMDMIESELLAKRPILYSAYDSSEGGHAFIFSGIDESGLVYVNWGWDGDGDGNYEVALLNPGGFRFSEGQTMNIGIKPMAASGPEGVYQSKWISYYDNCDTYSVSYDKKKLQTSYYYLYNVNFLPFTGEVGLLIESNDGTGFQTLKTVEEMATEEIGYYEGYTNMDFDDYGYYNGFTPIEVSVNDVPAGCYKVSWASKANQEDTPQLLLNDQGKVAKPFYFQKKADGKLSVSATPLVTGITTIPQESRSNSQTFDLQGRQVNAKDRAAKGILIQNGKKIVK